MNIAARTQSTGLRVRGFIDRVRRRLHRPSYWRKLASTYPLNGLTRERLSALVDDERKRRHECSDVVPLTGLEINEGRCLYASHDLGVVGRDVSELLHTLERGASSVDVKPLLQAGLAVQTRLTSQANANALVFSPHRDDASLSLGGLIGSRGTQEAHFICNVFTVSTWLGKGFHECPMHEVSQLRTREEALCNEVLGARGVGLGLWEADIRNYHRQSTENYSVFEDFIFEGDPKLRTPGERDSIEYALSYLLQSLEPTRIYFPLGLGDHIDHIFLHEFGKAKINQIRNRPGQCKAYFYEDLPYATYEHVDAATMATNMGLVPEFIDITDAFEMKIQAISAHRSQFARSENEERLRHYASTLAGRAGMPQGALAERIWRWSE